MPVTRRDGVFDLARDFRFELRRRRRPDTDTVTMTVGNVHVRAVLDAELREADDAGDRERDEQHHHRHRPVNGPGHEVHVRSAWRRRAAAAAAPRAGRR